jgi:hypothetical protein
MIKMEHMGIIDVAEGVMHEKGPKEAIKVLEEFAGIKAPKGMCVCESKEDGTIIILGTPCHDRKAVLAFYKLLEMPGGGASDGYEGLKARCNGNYAKSD